MKMYVCMFSIQFVTVNGFSVILLMLKLLNVKIVVSCDVHEYFLLKRAHFMFMYCTLNCIVIIFLKHQKIWCTYMFTNFWNYDKFLEFLSLFWRCCYVDVIDKLY